MINKIIQKNNKTPKGHRKIVNRLKRPSKVIIKILKITHKLIIKINKKFNNLAYKTTFSYLWWLNINI